VSRRPEATAAEADPAYRGLPQQQQEALRRAVKLERITLLVMALTVAAVYLVAGQSQAMKAAWIEDSLSLLPPLAFLLAVRRAWRRRDRENPYGYHRSIGVAHLVAAVALLTMGVFLIVDSSMGLILVERPPIGIVVLFGQPIWAGWLMIVVMLLSGIAPVILGRMKLPLAETLHDKVLYADADMQKADWLTALATAIGVVGIGFGLWWFDAAAAILVSLSIISDGVKNLRAAIGGLTDARARTYDESSPHPLTRQVEERAEDVPWVAEAAGRVRDEGHVFHVEIFVVPHDGAAPSLEQMASLKETLTELDWKIHDVVVMPVAEIPEYQVPRP